MLERIRAELEELGVRLRGLLRDEKFDPASSTRAFRMIGSDYSLSAVGAALSRRVFCASPHATLRFDAWHSGAFEEIDEGAFDLFFFGADTPAHLSRETLFTDRMVCVVSDDHPLRDKSSITMRDYLRYRHIVMDVEDGRQPVVDRILDARGTPRKAGLTMPFHAVAPLAVRDSKLILTIPEKLLGPFIAAATDAPSLRVLNAPPEIATMDYCMAWHSHLVSRF